MIRLRHEVWMGARGLRALLKALDADLGMTRFVGGCVRDTLLGLPVNDVDLTTRLRPDEVIERLRAAGIKAVPTGIAHGTVTGVAEGKPYEVTTLRRDVETNGRHATITYTDDWREDAARRDFTINALYADPGTGEVHDYFGGLNDLAGRRVRFIGDALTRIAEDHLRILRFFRFHARFGTEAPDAAGLDACTARANDLMALSRERIADELLKLLALPEPAATVRLMIERGIFTPVLPEVVEAETLERLIAAERGSGIEPHPLRRFAALLPADAALATAVATRLRLSNKAAKRLALAADRTTGDARRLAYAIGTDGAVDRLLLAGEDPGAIRDWQPPRLPLSGGELIGMGLTAGPEVARTLQAVERAWVEAGFPDRETAKAIARAKVEEALAGR